MAADTSPKDRDLPTEKPISRFFPGISTVSRSQFVRQSLELILPSTCRICDQCVDAGADFCRQCLVQLRSSEESLRHACPRCGLPGAAAWRTLTAHHEGADVKNGCRRCDRVKHDFDACIPLWTYEGLVRNAVITAKYGNQLALADALGTRLACQIRTRLEDSAELSPLPGGPPDLVTAVPSHLWRRMQRGNGGSRALARSATAALRMTWPTIRFVDLLVTTRRIKKQALMKEKARISNVSGAFRLRPRGFGRGPRRRIAGKHVLLVDDVMTTGATADEIARVLKQAGARRVTVAVVARARCG